MSMGLIALITLFLVVVVGFVKKMNVGLLAIAAAVILGYGSGQFGAKDIIGGFSASLFMTLLGVTFLFGVVQSNGCLDVVVKKATKLFGKQVWMIPILMYMIGWGMAAIGPGCVPALAFVAAIAIPLAHATGYDPIMLMMIGDAATYAGRFTAITPEGVLVTKLMGEQNITGILGPMIINVTGGTLLLCVIIYCFYKGYKVKAFKEVQGIEDVKLSGKQGVALVGILVMIAGVVLLKMDVGLASFLVAVALVLVGAGNEKTAFKNVPWGTLVLVCGVGVLMKLVIGTGGIDLLAATMASIMTPGTAAAITGMTAGIMSWFSSTMGVVLPTLLPTVGTIVDTVGGAASAVEIVSVIGIISSCAGFSPASTVGAIVMAAYEGDPEFSKQRESGKLFIELFAWSVFCVVFFAAIALTGVFGIIG